MELIDVEKQAWYCKKDERLYLAKEDEVTLKAAELLAYCVCRHPRRLHNQQVCAICNCIEYRGLYGGLDSGKLLNTKTIS
jgi:hypothetical protein